MYGARAHLIAVRLTSTRHHVTSTPLIDGAVTWKARRCNTSVLYEHTSLPSRCLMSVHSLNWLPVFHLHQQTPQTLRPNLDEISAAASVSLTRLIASTSSARLEPGLINATKIKRG